MNVSTKDNLVRTGIILINCGYILAIIVWLLETKLLEVVLFSPAILLNIHWDTAWAIHRAVSSVISFFVFSVFGFLIWRLNMKVFRKK